MFRDKDELAAASGLGDELNQKIAQSDRLIVCCSPAAAGSEWVDREVAAFIAARGADDVLAVILDGEPQAVFPPSLRGREPLAADFRKSADGEELGFLKLVAGLLRVDLGELRDRAAAAERARVRNRTTLAGVFAVLAVFATASAVYAVQQRNHAEAMAREAIDIGAGLVAQTEELSRKFGMPSSAIEELLRFADTRFERLFAEGVKSDDLEYQRAGMAVQFADFYGRVGDTARQKASAERALAMFDRFPKDATRTVDYVRATAAVADAQFNTGDTEGAAESYEFAIKSARIMMADIPDGVWPRVLLGGSLQRLGEIRMKQGRAAEAAALFKESIPPLQHLSDAAPEDELRATNLLAALDWYGGAQNASGDRAGALTTLRETITRGRAWVKARPESLAARSTLGNSLMKLGQTLSDNGDPRAARAPLEESVAIARTLAASDPRNARFRKDLALRLMLTANVLVKLGESGEPLMSDAITAGRALVAEDPANVDQRRTLALMLATRAERYAKQNAHARALAAWRETTALRRGLKSADVGSIKDLAWSLEGEGDAHAKLRDAPAAARAYGEAATLRRQTLATAPQDAAAKKALADTLFALGLTKKFADDAPGATAALKESAQLRTALSRATPRDDALAFSAVDSWQQLAVLQAAVDANATVTSLEQAAALLRPLVARKPDDARYAASLKKTEDMLASIAAWRASQAAATPN